MYFQNTFLSILHITVRMYSPTPRHVRASGLVHNMSVASVVKTQLRRVDRRPQALHAVSLQTNKPRTFRSLLHARFCKAGKWLRKKPRFFRFLKKPKKLKSQNLGFLGFLFFGQILYKPY